MTARPLLDSSLSSQLPQSTTAAPPSDERENKAAGTAAAGAEAPSAGTGKMGQGEECTTKQGMRGMYTIPLICLLLTASTTRTATIWITLESNPQGRCTRCSDSYERHFRPRQLWLRRRLLGRAVGLSPTASSSSRARSVSVPSTHADHLLPERRRYTHRGPPSSES